ncbi:unnamed protein product [Strongylus vulgaris]|uniref:Histone H2A/H2B/H3 domain-containing protein n=1 Tax=Strongylus vulgaris TaxID=40348 RepID=A0A3P7J9W7_STRVU|nr:unnamed protein product [Strongylus vulgaris]
MNCLSPLYPGNLVSSCHQSVSRGIKKASKIQKAGPPKVRGREAQKGELLVYIYRIFEQFRSDIEVSSKAMSITNNFF